MPQQHNPGRHVQSLTLPQSRHNHRNTSAYIFPTVPTPRTTPPTPGTASPRRRAPTLQLPVATRPLHSRHSPAAAQRFHRSDASEHPADTGPRLAAGLQRSNSPTQRSNSPTQRSRPIQGIPLPPHTGSTPFRRLGPPYQRRSPMLHLSAATHPRHSRHSPAAEHRPHIVPTPRPPADTGPRLAAGHCPASPPGPNAPTPRRNAPAPFKAHTCRRTPVPTAPTPRTTPPTPGHASPPGPNAPTPRRNAPAPFKTHPCRRTTAAQRPHTVPTLGPPRRRRIQPHRRAQKNPALRAGPIHLSVIFQ